MNPEITTLTGDLTFTQRFSATRRGARLARRLTVQQLADWGVPYDTDASHAAALVAGELAANAVTHGRVPGRDFELRLTLDGVRLTIEVSDTAPAHPHPRPAAPLAEHGRGLHLIDALTTAWGVRERPGGGPGKTVWARLKTT